MKLLLPAVLCVLASMVSCHANNEAESRRVRGRVVDVAGDDGRTVERSLQSVTGLGSLLLVHTGTTPPHRPILNLTWDAVNVIDLAVLNVSVAQFNLHAVRTTTGVASTVQSVLFSNGRAESGQPFAYCGNSGTTFFTCPDLVVGATVQVTVTPYSLKLLQGTPGPTRSTTVRIVDSRITTKSPMLSPTKSPTAAPQCSVPKLNGTSWTPGTAYPLKVAEAQGMMVNKSLFVVFGGFYKGWQQASNATHVLDTSVSTSTWKRVDDMPIAAGLTHGAHVVRGNSIYNCGGYVGGHPGTHTSTCLVYTASQPTSLQWTTMTPLPQGRGGGGMFYSAVFDAMFYISGAQRVVVNGTLISTLDFNTTWMYAFQNNPQKRWVRKADLPFASNHLMAVTAKVGTRERHFAFGGQYRENEYGGNYDFMFEYNVTTNEWTQRASLLQPRAHASSSTHPVGCGVVVVGGNTNGGKILSDVSYYHVPTNTWSLLGNLPAALNTPVCDVNGRNILICETGKLRATNSFQRQLVW